MLMFFQNYIYHQNQLNVGKYMPYLQPNGIGGLRSRAHAASL